MDTSKSLPEGYLLTGPAGSYRIVKVLGRGGFGITYLATARYRVNNIVHTVQYAIKEHFIGSLCERDVTHAVTTGGPSSTTVESSRKDFIGEARRLQKIGNQHPSIVKVNEVFEANNTAYYVMEFLNGESLRKYIERHGALSEEETQRIIQPIAQAVDYLHQNRLTHLDIKPDNIMLTQEEDEQGNIVTRPVLIDFGLSKHYDSSGQATSTINTLGCSDGYAPVEQYAGIKTFSPKADIYSLAATYLHCLTGKCPPKSTELLTMDVDAMLREIMPPVSDELRSRLAPSLSPSPAMRCDSLVMDSVRQPQPHTVPADPLPAPQAPSDTATKAVPVSHDNDAAATLRLDEPANPVEQEAPKPQKPKKPKKSKRLKIILLSAAAAIILIAGGWWGYIAYKDAKYQEAYEAFNAACNANDFDTAEENLMLMLDYNNQYYVHEQAGKFFAGAYGNREWCEYRNYDVAQSAINHFLAAYYKAEHGITKGRILSEIGNLYAHNGWGIYPPRNMDLALDYFEQAGQGGDPEGILKAAAYSIIRDSTLYLRNEFMTTKALELDALNGNNDFSTSGALGISDVYRLLSGEMPPRFEAFYQAPEHDKNKYFSAANELLGVYYMTQPYAVEKFDDKAIPAGDESASSFDARMNAAEECFKKIDPEWANYADRSPDAIPTLREYRLHQLAEYRNRKTN